MKTKTDLLYQALLAVLFAVVLGMVLLIGGRETIQGYRSLSNPPARNYPEDADLFNCFQQEIAAVRRENEQLAQEVERLRLELASHKSKSPPAVVSQ